MVKWLKSVFYKVFDYEIVGEYYDRHVMRNGGVLMKKKYIRRYFLRRKGVKKHV